MPKIRVAIAGVGNCASSLVQGVYHYQNAQKGDILPGVMHLVLGGYHIGDLEFVAAFDVDERKVGKDLSEAIFAEPNCTTKYHPVPYLGVPVQRGPVLDGVGGTLVDVVQVDPDRPAVDVTRVLRETRTDVLVCYLPVGSREATEFYAEAALAVGAAFVNTNPEPIATNPVWAERFRKAGVPVLGDDVKSQLGATFIHRALIEACNQRGMIVDRTYQLNFGGNSDFLNMQDRKRVMSKRATKMGAVEFMAKHPLEAAIGPSEFIPFLKDHKVCYLRLEGRGFLGMPFDVELRLSVEDSPNSAGVVIDAIRAAKVALDLGVGGPVEDASAFLFKNPPRQMPDKVALGKLEEFCERRTGR